MIDGNGIEQEGRPPPWFENIDEPEPEEDESDSSRWRMVIAVGAVLVIAVMLLIPVLQAELLQRRRESLPDTAMERTALLFASAILFGRSEGQALLFSSDDSEDEVRSVLRVVLDRPQPSNRARLQISSTPCGQREADACFTGRVFDPSNPFQTGIRFGLERLDGEPVIVWVELDQSVV